LSVKAFPIHRDESRREEYFYVRNVESAKMLDLDSLEITKISEAMMLAQELHIAGWRVKVAPFEDMPILQVRSKKKRKT
jgi:hypothetical protein